MRIATSPPCRRRARTNFFEQLEARCLLAALPHVAESISSATEMAAGGEFGQSGLEGVFNGPHSHNHSLGSSNSPGSISADWITEREMRSPGQRNNTLSTAQHLSQLGSGPHDVNELTILGSLGTPVRELHSPQEDDGSIPKANATGIRAGHDDSIIVRGHVGDGPHGNAGTGFGDYDYYKFSASAGQLVHLAVESESLFGYTYNTDPIGLDSVVVLYDSQGNLLTYNDDEAANFWYGYRMHYDSSLTWSIPATGDYYAVVFSSFDFQASPFDSASGAGDYSEGDYHLAISTETARKIASTEEDGAIPFATPTGLVAGQAGVVYASGVIGDGLYGLSGTGTGDFDVYRVDALAGQRIVVNGDSDPRFKSTYSVGLDSIVSVYNSQGVRQYFANHGLSKDPFITFEVTSSDAYYVVISGLVSPPVSLPPDFFTVNFLANRFDPASGGGARSEGTYGLRIETQMAPDIDYYSVDLAAGDILSLEAAGGARYLELRGPDGEFWGESTLRQERDMRRQSPMLKQGELNFTRIVSEAGRYSIGVKHESLFGIDGDFFLDPERGPYELKVRVDRPYLESQPVYTHQVLFLDFDGAPGSAVTEAFNGFYVPTVDQLSPISASLASWGIPASQESAFIDATIAQVTRFLSTDVSGIVGRGANGEFLVTNEAGDFQIEILNSRDHADTYGLYPNVSRMIIGTTSLEIGRPDDFGYLLGIAPGVDLGNFDLSQTAFTTSLEFQTIMDNFGFSIAPTASRLQAFAFMTAETIAHEAGHIFGNDHTNSYNGEPVDVMDTVFHNLVMGFGSDGVFGTADDTDQRFGNDLEHDNFDRHPAGHYDTLNNIAFGLSTGTQSGTYFDFVTGTLYVTGEIDDGHKDELEVKTVGSNLKVYINDELVLQRPAAGVNRVVLNGSSDRDELDASQFSGSVTLFGRDGKDELTGGQADDLLFGGDDDDELSGRDGNDILVGGDGDDELQGGNGRDVLIGGRGKDELEGGAGDDLLIAGFTAFDSNASALQSVLAEWTSSRSYTARIANLTNQSSGPRANGAICLLTTGPSKTMFNDSDKDDLEGNSGRDWFFATLNPNQHRDDVEDKQNDETVTPVA